MDTVDRGGRGGRGRYYNGSSRRGGRGGRGRNYNQRQYNIYNYNRRYNSNMNQNHNDLQVNSSRFSRPKNTDTSTGYQSRKDFNTSLSNSNAYKHAFPNDWDHENTSNVRAIDDFRNWKASNTSDSEVSVLSDTEGAHFVPFGRGHNANKEKTLPMNQDANKPMKKPTKPPISLRRRMDRREMRRRQVQQQMQQQQMQQQQMHRRQMHTPESQECTKTPDPEKCSPEPQKQDEMQDNNDQKGKGKSEADSSYNSPTRSLEYVNTESVNTTPNINKMGHFADDYLKKKAAVQQIQRQINQQHILLNKMEQRTNQFNPLLFASPIKPITPMKTSNIMYSFTPPVTPPQKLQFPPPQNIQFTPPQFSPRQNIQFSPTQNTQFASRQNMQFAPKPNMQFASRQRQNKQYPPVNKQYDAADYDYNIGSGVDWEDADYDYNGYDYDGYDYDGKEWDVCWAFNTAKGCRKGGWCEWRHAHYEE